MLELALSEAFTKTLGLIITFGGIGLIANGLIIYIFVQVRGERQQNEEYRRQIRQQRPGA
jgi:hypothetical protein